MLLKPKNKAGIEFYNQYALQMASENNRINRAEVHKYSLPLLKEMSRSDRISILDIGCGSGVDPNFFVEELNCNVVGVEPAKTFLDQAIQEFSRSEITWINDDLPTLDQVRSLKQKFDAVTLTSVWQYVHPDDRVEALQTLQSLCKPGGHILIQYPSVPSRDYQYRLPPTRFRQEFAEACTCPNKKYPMKIVDSKTNPDTRGRKAINGKPLVFEYMDIRVGSEFRGYDA